MEPPSEFEKAGDDSEANFFSDLWQFLRTNKKWWLIPILVVLLGLAALALLSGSAVTPFIYTLF